MTNAEVLVLVALSPVLVAGWSLYRTRRRLPWTESRLRSLATALHSASRELGSARDLQEDSQRAALAGRFVAQVVHEMSGPVQVLAGYLPRLQSSFERVLEVLGDRAEPARDLSVRELAQEIADCLRCLLESEARMMAVYRQFRSFELKDTIPLEPLDPAEALRLARRIHQGECPEGVCVELEVGSLPPVWGQPGQMERIWLHLIRNASDATEGRGKVSVDAKTSGLGVLIRFADDGPGIPRSLVGHVFEPFFSTKSAHGSGLGLSECREIVRCCGGWIESDPDYHEGARLLVWLRRADVEFTGAAGAA